MKKAIYIIMFFILITSVYADKVSIFNFNYDNGKITLKQQIIKEGYYPDRNIKAEEGYICKLVDNQGNELYSFRFELPTKLYTDIIKNSTIYGNVVILNETDFSFIMPYFNEAVKLLCYNPGEYEIINQDVEKIILSPEKRNTWLWIYAILAVIGFIIMLTIKKSSNR